MEHGSSPTNSLGRTPLQIAGRFAVLLDFPGFLILESTTRVLWNMGVRPAHLIGHRASVRLCGNDILLGLRPPLFSGPKIPFPGNREPDCGDPEGEDEMLPSPFGGILAAGRRVALPGARLERGIKLRINRAVPMGLIRGKSEGLVLSRPFDGQITQARDP